MAINRSKVFSTLNDLIETLKDGENGFKAAADAIDEPDLKSLFMQYSNQRARYISELETFATQFGGKVDESGSIAGALHRGWMNLKSALSSKDVQAILNECERGEDNAVKEFSEALHEELPASVKAVISDQYGEIKSVHDNVKRMRDMHSK